MSAAAAPTISDRVVAHDILLELLRIRRFEEECAKLYSAGKIRGFLHLYVGEEAIAVGAMRALDTHDAIVSTYREHGHALARGIPATAIMAEMFGKREGCSRGRGGSMHLFDIGRRFYGGNAIVAGGLPLAVGLALADSIMKRPSVTACFFGDGATAEGEFHESLNLAALWRLPVLFLCENNGYAMGTALDRYQSEVNLSRKAASYGIASKQVDGMDVEAVLDAAKGAVAWVRNEQRPFFLELLTYRFRAHSMFDPELYRTKAEVEEWKKRDPIQIFRARLAERNLLTALEEEQLAEKIDAEIRAAVSFAEAGTWEAVEDLTKDVYTPAAERNS